MGRGKGRAKGIDVTKQFFQSSGSPDRILVQIAPSHTLHVREEDVRPTRGSDAAFALRRDGRAEGVMKLCPSWRQGACHSSAACSNAHVTAYFNSSGPASLGGHSTPQQQHHHPTGAGAAEPGRMMESKSPAMSAHNTRIPAPRSQQANRQASVGGSSAAANSPSAGTAWGRSGVTNGSQHGGYQSFLQQQPQQPQQPQHQQQTPQQSHQYQRHQHHQHQQHPQQSQSHQQHQQHHQQQHELLKQPQQQQPYSTPQSRNWVIAQRSSEDTWPLSNDIAGEMLLSSTLPKSSGINERNIVETPHIPIHRNSRTTNRGDGLHFTLADHSDGALGSDAWLSSTIGQSSAANAIWCDSGSGTWDFPRSSATTNVPALWTTTLSKEDNFTFTEGKVNTKSSLASHGGEPWGSCTRSGGESAVGKKVVSTVSSSPEALTKQLLRELVGAGSEANDAFAVDTQLRTSINNDMYSGSPFSVEKTLSDVPNVLGGGDCGIGVGDRGRMAGGGPSAPTASAHKIQHLMSLLTSE